MRICPRCSSTNCVKNGTIHNGKTKHQGNDCGRQFVDNPQNTPISVETKKLINKLLLEKIPLAGIARVTTVSERWLQYYVNALYESISKKVEVQDKPKGRLTIECDEVWSFVGNKGHKVWIWLAIDLDSREIVGVYVGTRDKGGAHGLWDSLPPVYRQCAIVYTDFWKAYSAVFLQNGIKLLAKRLAKPAILNASIARCANEYRDSFEKLSLSPKSWPIISELFGILFTTTTLLLLNHYLYRTT